MSGSYRIKCWVCATPLCQLEQTENWYCPKCKRWLVLSASRTKTPIRRRESKLLERTKRPRLKGIRKLEV